MRYNKKIKRKFYNKDFKIESKFLKVKDVKKILVISDIHYHPGVNKDIFSQLVVYSKKSKPNFVVIAGDLIETANFLDIEKEKNFFEKTLKDISKIAPLIIVPGNHEVSHFNRLEISKNKYEETLNVIEYLESLNKYKNIYFLNNRQVEIEGINFIGFNPSVKTYLKRKERELFIKEYLNSGLNMPKDKYNVFITHSPLFLGDSVVLEKIKDFRENMDLAIAGHFHDGYIPKWMDIFFANTKIGLFITPLLFPIPGTLCRGIHKIGRGYLLISQGYRKYTPNKAIFNFFEKFTANDVETIYIKKEVN